LRRISSQNYSTINAAQGKPVTTPELPICRGVALNHQTHHFLLVENDANEAQILDKAFAAIPDCVTVSIARNVSEAKAYLKGAWHLFQPKEIQNALYHPFQLARGRRFWSGSPHVG
jgi:hypothetical protein